MHTEKAVCSFQIGMCDEEGLNQNLKQISCQKIACSFYTKVLKANKMDTTPLVEPSPWVVVGHLAGVGSKHLSCLNVRIVQWDDQYVAYPPLVQ